MDSNSFALGLLDKYMFCSRTHIRTCIRFADTHIFFLISAGTGKHLQKKKIFNNIF